MNVQPLNVGKASEEAGQHLGIIAESEMEFQGQDLHRWDHGPFIHQCPSLLSNQIQSSETNQNNQFNKDRSQLSMVSNRSNTRCKS
jgi:hypothetical protein